MRECFTGNCIQQQQQQISILSLPLPRLKSNSAHVTYISVYFMIAIQHKLYGISHDSCIFTTNLFSSVFLVSPRKYCRGVYIFICHHQICFNAKILVKLPLHFDRNEEKYELWEFFFLLAKFNFSESIIEKEKMFVFVFL